MKSQGQAKYGLMAFVIPLAIRSVPEMLAWPYLIGFDTLEYADVISRGTYLSLGLVDALKSTSLFYVVATVVGGLLGDALLTVKVLGPVLFALLCGSFYVYSSRVLGWSSWKALAISILAGTYFVSLRVSWEMYRQMLGFIFLMVALMGLRVSSVRWKTSVVMLSGFLAVWSHELAAVLYFVLVAAHILVGRGLRSRILMALMATPAFLLLVYQLYNPAIGGFLVPYENVSSASWIESAVFISGFLAYMFLPLLPLAVLGALSFRGIDVLSWLVVGLLFTYWPVFLPEHSVVFWFRWAILLVYPVLFLSVEGIKKLWEFGSRSLWKIRAGGFLALSIISLNLVMGGYYLTSLPEHQIEYFGEWNHYKQYIQTSMLQNSVSLADTPDVVKALRWLGEVAESSSVLVLHEAMDDWARLLVKRVEIVRVDEVDLSSPMRENVAARLVQLAAERAETGSEVYTVWWVDGKGWYRMLELPSQFTEIRRFGDIGVFQYRQGAWGG